MGPSICNTYLPTLTVSVYGSYYPPEYTLYSPSTAISGTLSDFCDGINFRSHPLFVNSNSLQILLYYDDLEIFNPLGSSRTKHKLGKCSMIAMHVCMYLYTVYNF